MAHKTVLAIDLGAASGRVMAVQFDGRSLHVEEMHRFPNSPVWVGETLYWDILFLWREIQAGIDKGKSLKPASIGVDAWGVDFGLLDASGSLIGNPVHYRDRRTQGMMEAALRKISREQIYTQTGIQFMPINTLFQLLSLVEQRAPALDMAATFITIPDLINYWLSGSKVCEFTNATTTQMFDPVSANWAFSLLESLEIPTHILPEIVQPGTHLGEYQGIPVITPASHDTGSAVVAVPTQTDDCAYISSGTWSLVGLEVDQPVINAQSLAANVTNEGGANNRYRLLKNVMGLWILQQCQQTWAANGAHYSASNLVSFAEKTPPLVTLIQPNDPRFLPPGDHPQLILEYCNQTQQSLGNDRGSLVRCVLESLALKYRHTFNELQNLTGKSIDVVHIMGGGSKIQILNQMTANAAGVEVISGPVEATVIGNALVQFIALGEIKDFREARQLVYEMDSLQHFQPQDKHLWDDAYQRFHELSENNA